MSATVNAYFHRLIGPPVMEVAERLEAGSSWIGISHSTGTICLALGREDGTVIAAGLTHDQVEHFALMLAEAMEAVTRMNGMTRQ